MSKPNWSLIAEENGITISAAHMRWFRFKASVKEEGNRPKQELKSSLGITRKKRKQRNMEDDNESTSGNSLRKVVKEGIKVERDLEELPQQREEVQEASVVVKVENNV